MADPRHKIDSSSDSDSSESDYCPWSDDLFRPYDHDPYLTWDPDEGVGHDDDGGDWYYLGRGEWRKVKYSAWSPVVHKKVPEKTRGIIVTLLMLSKTPAPLSDTERALALKRGYVPSRYEVSCLDMLPPELLNELFEWVVIGREPDVSQYLRDRCRCGGWIPQCVVCHCWTKYMQVFEFGDRVIVLCNCHDECEKQHKADQELARFREQRRCSCGKPCYIGGCGCSRGIIFKEW
jgi:hypothetical protein